MLAPQFVRPYLEVLKSQKNDANDAEAIYEAVETSEHEVCAEQIRERDRRIGSGYAIDLQRRNAQTAGVLLYAFAQVGEG